VQSFDLSLFSIDDSSDTITISAATRASPQEANAPVPPPEIQLVTNTFPQIVVTLPPESITTIVVSNIPIATNSSPNLIQNGDFESATGSFWTVVNKGNLTVNSFPWTGSFSAVLNRVNQSEPPSSLQQAVQVPRNEEGFDESSPAKLFLSLWASTLGLNSKIIVYVGFSIVEEVSISPLVGYRLYSLDFLVYSGDEVQLVIENSDDSGPEVYIDDVQLRYSFI